MRRKILFRVFIDLSFISIFIHYTTRVKEYGILCGFRTSKVKDNPKIIMFVSLCI